MAIPSATDLQTLAQLRRRDEAAYQLLYRAYFPMIERLVVRNSGTPDDARDLFQDTLLVLVGQLDDEDWSLTASLKTYLYAVAHRQWLARLRQQARTERVDGDQLAELAVCDPIETDGPSAVQRLTHWLSRITVHCQTLLRVLFFGQSKPALTSYKNANTARNQQYKCLQQVRRIADQDHVE